MDYKKLIRELELASKLARGDEAKKSQILKISIALGKKLEHERENQIQRVKTRFRQGIILGIVVITIIFIIVLIILNLIGFSVRPPLLTPTPSSTATLTPLCTSLKIESLEIRHSNESFNESLFVKNGEKIEVVDSPSFSLHPQLAKAHTGFCEFEWIAVFEGGKVSFYDQEFNSDEEYLLFRESNCKFLLIISPVDREQRNTGSPVSLSVELNECPYE